MVTKSNLGQKKLICLHLFPYHSPGSHGRNPEARAEAEAKLERSIMAYLLWLLSLLSYSTQDHQSVVHYPL